MSTSAPHPRYADGAVSPQRHPDILNKLEILLKECLFISITERLFKSWGRNTSMHVGLMGEEVYRKTWIVLLRFSRSIEDQVGIAAKC